MRERDFTFITGPRDNPESRTKSRDKTGGKNPEEPPDGNHVYHVSRQINEVGAESSVDQHFQDDTG